MTSLEKWLETVRSIDAHEREERLKHSEVSLDEINDAIGKYLNGEKLHYRLTVSSINACLFVAALSDVPAESVAKIKEALKSGTIVLEKVPDGCDPTAKLIELCVEVLPVSAWNAAMMEHDLAVREGKRKGFSDSIDTRNIAILKMLATDLDSPSRFILRSPILIKAVFDAFNTPED